MHLEVLPNPNCQASEEFVFKELGPARPIRGIRIEERGRPILCEVAGVGPAGSFVQAYAMKINDSGAGHAYLIYGGPWGIRIKPEPFTAEPWDLVNPHQWGEPFKIYGDEEDIFYGD